MIQPIPKPPKRGPKPKKRIRQVIDQLWVQTRDDWLDLNPPDENGNYQCALCPYWVYKDEVTLDHIITRSRNKALKYEHSNLQPAHWKCNVARGSMTMEAWNRRRKAKDCA